MAKRKRSDRDGPHSGGSRCAVYTRKSTEEGLDQAFNSLDAQYEACAAYIASQRHESWIQIRERYDDGGFSGASLERPALQRLLADVASGKVQVIVLYKIDRLTRSLADFAKIVDVLDKAGASFVSVTQSFNTTTSMGRLTLNMLLSFAQFEREVTAERIRDKVAASKARGMWMGGPVPLGYRVEQRKLLVEEADAETVRHIFQRYVELGSGQALLDELREQGYRTKRQVLSNGQTRGRVPFARGTLFHLLGNRIYLGEIVHKGTAYPGEHPAIIEPALWQAVQDQIAANSIERKSGRNLRDPSLLTGIIIDGLGRRMSPSHAVKGARRYRYYITHASAIVDKEAAWRIGAHDVEAVVIGRLKTLFEDRGAIRDMVHSVTDDGQALATALDLAHEASARLTSSSHKRMMIAQLVTRVKLLGDAVEITIDRRGVLERLGRGEQYHIPHPLILTASINRARIGKQVRLVLVDGSDDRDAALVALIAEAQVARAAVLEGPDKSIKDIAAASGQCRHRLARLIKLSWLAPAIIEAIMTGRQPVTLIPKHLLTVDLPLDWTAQKAALGFG
jgi:site-specific DNA recombinase